MLKIALCVKQVPDTTDIRWTENNTIQREGIESVINPFDVYALELALKIKKDIKDVEITAFSMGPLQAESMLRKLIAFGCDDAVLLSDKKFAGSDTYATALVLSTAIKSQMPDYDLIICGQFATDGDTAQTPPNIATFLDKPQVTFVKDYVGLSDNRILLTRLIDEGKQTVSAKLPVVIGVLQGDFEPTRARIRGIIKASNKKIKILNIEDLGLSSEQVGVKGSPTYVNKAFRKVTNHKSVKYKQETAKSVKMIKEIIKSTLGG